jgi:hypothetical protein
MLLSSIQRYRDLLKISTDVQKKDGNTLDQCIVSVSTPLHQNKKDSFDNGVDESYDIKIENSVGYISILFHIS